MTVVFEVTGMHCSNCGLLVDNAVEDVPGVISSSTDIRAGRTVVEGAAAVPEILAAISRTGYTGRLV